MNVKTWEVFQAVRRVYRLTRKGSCMVSNGLGSIAAATALRAVTGKSNLCALTARDGDEGRLAQ